jgi:hypothetical protein
LQLNKKVLRICKQSQRNDRCNAECVLFSKCIIKQGKYLSLIDYVKEINQYSEGIENV